MKVLIAMDSFKGSLSSLEAGEAAAEGIKKVYKEAKILIRPLADGGEGTVDALVEGMGGEYKTLIVKNPITLPISVRYGILPKKNTAIIETASAAGLTLLEKEGRNPLYTTTYGVGEMIKDAIEKGCRDFIIGLGGSATNDAGIGMLQALGYQFFDKEGKEAEYGAIGLKDIVSINDERAMPELKKCRFRIACDVSNPLCGKKGCSTVFALQKGATEEMIKDMDGWLFHYANTVKEIYPQANPDYPGAGAAGGLGFAFLSFLNAELLSGIDIVLQATNLAEYIKDADFIITGEGRLDGQSVLGKAPIGLANLAKKSGKKVIAFAGAVSEDAQICNRYGIDAFFPILRSITGLEEAMNRQRAWKNMSDSAEQVFRLIQCIEKDSPSFL